MRTLVATWCRALLVAGWTLALSLGTARIAHADTACAPMDVSCVTGGAAAPSLPPDPTGGTADHAGDQVSDAQQSVQDTVSNTEDTINGVLGPGSGDPDRGPGGGGPGGPGTGPRGGHDGGRNSHRPGTAGPGQAGAPGPLTPPSSAPNAGGPGGSTAGGTVDDPSQGRPSFADTVAGIAIGVVAPLLILIGCIFAFVTFQQKLDERDPHLTEAPSTPEVAMFS
jgi:hypothetical protein